MVYRGTVQGGLVVLEPGVHLPDGMNVTIQPVQAAPVTTPPFISPLRNGVPDFPSHGNGTVSNLDLVNKLRDEPL
jgi:hypothetical protein